MNNVNELAKQLRCPSGIYAKEVGENMYKSNSNMIHKTIDVLELKNNEKILEIGFGNGKHLPYLFSKAYVQYYGLETSEAMLRDAQENNADASYIDVLMLQKADGSGELNHQDKTFHSCFSVNTIYFWKDPAFQFQEIHRILKPTGLLSITFVDRAFGEQLPFTQSGFKFYDSEHLVTMLNSSGFTKVEEYRQTEETISKDRQIVVRPFTIIKAEKGVY